MSVLNVGELANCSNQSKMNTIGVLERLLELYDIARQYGLLELENSIQDDESFLLNLGLELIIDGTDPEDVEAILSNYIEVGGYTSCQLLANLLIKDGIIMMQKGVNRIVFMRKLFSYYGEAYFERLENHFAKGIEEPSLIAAYEKKLVSDIGLTEYVNLINRLDNRGIQRMLREVDDRTLSIALQSTEPTLKKKVMDCVSVRRKSEIIKISLGITAPTKYQIHASQSHIIDIIKKLDTMGEIILSK